MRHLICLAAVLLGVAVGMSAPRPASAAPAPLVAQAPSRPNASAVSLRVETVHASVRPGRVATVRVRLVAARDLVDARLSLGADRVGDRVSLPVQVVQAPSLAMGVTDYQFGVRTPLGAEGAYRYRVTVSERGATLARAGGRFAVIDPTKRPALTVCLVWQVDEGVHIDPEGRFLDTRIADAVSRTPRRRGRLAFHAAQLGEHRRIRASVAMSPFTVSQVQRLARGGAQVGGDATRAIPPTSRASGEARAVLASWRRLLRLRRAESLAAPYVDAPLEELAARRLTDDMGWQLDVGRQVVRQALGSAAVPTVVRATPTTQGVVALADEGVTRIVAGALTTEAAARVPDRPILIKADSRVRVLVVDQALSAAVASPASAEDPIDGLIAALALRHLAGRRLVVLAPSYTDPAIDETRLHRLYQALGDSPWLRTATVREAVDAVAPYSRPATLTAEPTREGSDAYWRAQARGREDYLALESMTPTENPVRERARRTFLVAELAGQPRVASRWQRSAARAARLELAKVRVRANPSVTFTGQRGKVALSLTNETGYLADAVLLLSGDGVSFPDGRRLALSLRPKETVRTVRVAIVGARTNARVVARLVTGRRVLARTTVRVSSAYIDRLALVGAVILALVALLIYLWRRSGSERARTTSRRTEDPR